MLWMILSAISVGGGASGSFGLAVVGIMLAPVGIACGVLFNGWKNRDAPLSDADLATELQSMSLESLMEYKELCPPDSREYILADAELARRGRESA